MRPRLLAHPRLRELRGLLGTPMFALRLRHLAIMRAFPVAAVLARRYRAHAIPDTHLVAVVGSLGKTTTTRAVSAALGLPIHRLLEWNYRTNVGRALLRVRPRARFAVIEVGVGAPGEMTPQAEMVRPDTVVVTCIASEHLRSFGDLETTRHEKAEMLRALPARGLAVVNGDDPHVRWMATQTAARVVTFGLGPHNDVRALDLGIDWPRGNRFTVQIDGCRHTVATRLLGRAMVYPALAAVAVARSLDLDLDAALARLAVLPPTTGRLQLTALPGGAMLLRDEFKSTLETVHASLDLLEQIPARRKLVVLGEVSEPPGSQGPIYRELGQRVAAIADRAVFFGGIFERYRAGARRGGMAREAMANAGRSPQRALELLGTPGEGDVVLIKGRTTEHLERVSLALAGREVRCELPRCPIRLPRCDECPMLARGWGEGPTPGSVAQWPA